MRRLFVLSYSLLLLIGVACSLIGSSEQLAEEDRIATSVAETVAAQISLEAEPTDVSVAVAQTPVSSPPSPTLMPTPTRNSILTPTNTPKSTPVPSLDPNSSSKEEPNQILRVGDTIKDEYIALTLVDAYITDTYVDFLDRSSEVRKGYAYVYLEFSYLTLKPIPGLDYPGSYGLNSFNKSIIDSDGDAYFKCSIVNEATPIFPPGYGPITAKFYCEIPVTVADTVNNLQLELDIHQIVYTYDLGKRNESSQEINIEKEMEKHIQMGQKFILICGSQYNVEYLLENPRWEEVFTNDLFGLKKLTFDIRMTNHGKTPARRLDIDYLLNFTGYRKARGTNFADDKDDYFPVPGDTGVDYISIALPVTPIVPFVIENNSSDCIFDLGNYVVESGDYFVIEMNTGTVEVTTSTEQTLQSVDETAVTPTSTTVSTKSPCSNEPQGEFHDLWVKYREKLGCPIQTEPLTYQSAEQPFEGGHMFWVGEIELVLITIGNEQGDWMLYSDDWDGSDYSCPVQVPAGEIQPVRGFGWIWCREQTIRDGLGGGLKEEQGFSAGINLIQGFENGIIFRDSDGQTQGKAYVMVGKDQGTFVKESY